MDRKPSIFKPSISNIVNNNRKVYYSFIEEEQELKNSERSFISPVDKLRELMNKDGYIFNKNVIIKTNSNTYDTRIAGKIGENIITLDGNRINISDVKEIIEK